jgi:hypothetical protein
MEPAARMARFQGARAKGRVKEGNVAPLTPAFDDVDDVSVSLTVSQFVPRVRGNRWASWIAFNFILFLATSISIVYGVTTPYFKAAMGLSTVQVSLLDATPAFGVALLTIPVTLIARNSGELL